MASRFVQFHLDFDVGLVPLQCPFIQPSLYFRVLAPRWVFPRHLLVRWGNSFVKKPKVSASFRAVSAATTGNFKKEFELRPGRATDVMCINFVDGKIEPPSLGA